MSYREFTFPDVVTRLGLTLTSTRLFPDIQPVATSAEFLSRLDDGITLALGLDTEKARSEFVVAPILLEFRRLIDRRHALFSGVEFNIDPTTGLNGYCDFLITRGPEIYMLTAPVIVVAEAKNDNVNTGLGQCIAEMRAAWLFNQASKAPITQVYGAATTGTTWKFLRLRDTELTLDQSEYYAREVGSVLAILLHMAATA